MPPFMIEGLWIDCRTTTTIVCHRDRSKRICLDCLCHLFLFANESVEGGDGIALRLDDFLFLAQVVMQLVDGLVKQLDGVLL